MNKKTKIKITGIINRLYITILIIAILFVLLIGVNVVLGELPWIAFAGALTIPFIVYFTKKWLIWVVTGKAGISSEKGKQK